LQAIDHESGMLKKKWKVKKRAADWTFKNRWTRSIWHHQVKCTQIWYTWNKQWSEWWWDSVIQNCGTTEHWLEITQHTWYSPGQQVSGNFYHTNLLELAMAKAL